MLTQIAIHDLVTIECLQLNVGQGTTMITGETGAGKSIFIEAIQLALGSRASANLIRQGKEKAEIILSIDMTHFTQAMQLLKAHDLYDDHAECIIRRVILADGRSRCYVNGVLVPLQFMKTLGELLFHLHSQHEQQVLLKSELQRDILDRFADHQVLVNQVKNHALQWKACTSEIATVQQQLSDSEKQQAYLSFQLSELSSIELKINEWEALEAEHQKLTHYESIQQHLQTVLSKFSEEQAENIYTQLNQIRKALEAITSFDAKTHDWLNAFNSTLAQLKDVAHDIQHYVEKMEIDHERVQYLEERISQIFNLSRKYKIAPNELCAYTASIQHELQHLQSSQQQLTHLEQQQQTLAHEYQLAAAELSRSRQQAALQLSEIITLTMRCLSLPHCEFSILLEKNEEAITEYGNEKINFLIKTNPDQSLQPLAKVVSGGELSRLSLAAHLALAHRTNIPTLIFDEIDTGLSGATAKKIGKLLHKLGESYQVFCITHQAQVAACGHHHLLVEKKFIEQHTYTELRLLSAKEKVAEIARLLGGETITTKTLRLAEEVLEQA